MALALYPGLGLGKTGRPRLAFSLGYAPFGSVLAPIEVISDERLFSVASVQDDGVISQERINVLFGELTKDIISDEPAEAIKGEVPGGTVESALPPEDVKSEEPDD